MGSMWECGWGGGGRVGVYAASQTILLHMKRLNKTVSPILVRVFFVSKGSLLHFILLFCS